MADLGQIIVSGEEVLLGVIRGAVAGGVAGIIAGITAILVYFYKRKNERSANTRDNADILFDEMQRILGVAGIYHKMPVREVGASPLPNSEIYSGMLLTGNIRHLQADLRKKLARFHAHYRTSPLNPDRDLCIEILADLNEMRRK